MKQTGNNQNQVKRPTPASPMAAYTPPRMPNNISNRPATPPNPVSESPNLQPSFWAKLRLGDRILLPLRLFLSITFIYAGIQKLTDPQFFNPKAIGYIGKQIIAFATGSPLHYFLIRYAVPHAAFFGVVVALGEIAIGLGALFGVLFRPAAFFGLLVSLLFFLSASWRVYPYFYGADIVFVFAWITLLLAGPLRSGLPTFDGYVIPRFLLNLAPESRIGMERLTRFALGVGTAHVAGPQGYAQQGYGASGTAVQGQQGYQYAPGAAGAASYTRQQSQQAQQLSYKARIAAQRRALDNRRNFLWGLFAGGLGMLGITLVAKTVSVGSLLGEEGATTQTGVNTGTNTGTQSTPGASGGSSSAIAQVSQVPNNSAVTFTIPSNGDPGVLVRLNSGKFVCYDATCTHAGCPVSFDSGSGLLICPCHGAEFDPANGANPVAGPAPSPLTSVAINVNNTTGAITLQ